MQEAKVDVTRLIRFALWALAMLAAFAITAIYAPRKTAFVPVFFLPVMVPAVLMPLRSKRKE